jgi:hypothetical protein
VTEQWVSAETEPKERDFRGILATHMQICGAIISRSGGSYLYADLFAGPGKLQYGHKGFDGSPLIAASLAAQHPRMPFGAIHFEQDPGVADRLSLHLNDRAFVDPRPCQVGFREWLDRLGPNHRWSQGLVYSDPIRDEIPHELLSLAATKLPRVDILSYVSATQYKRRRGVDPARPLLSEHIAAVPKKVVLIRKATTAWQWTFVLWSNWPDYPAWEKRGFYRLDSPQGQAELARLDHTAAELQRMTETPLWGDDDAAQLQPAESR